MKTSALLLSSFFLMTGCLQNGGVFTPSEPLGIKSVAYSPPVSLRLTPECTSKKESTTQYKVTATGDFSFPVSEASVNLFEGESLTLKTVQLTTEEQMALQETLDKSHLAAEIKDSKPVPSDAPQTEECRTVSDIQMEVDGSNKTYDLNSRQLTHSENYRKQWKAIQAEFERLAKKYRDETPISTEAKYAFPPLKWVSRFECGDESQTQYEIQAFDTFLSYSSGKVKTERKLSAEEVQKLKEQLNQSDLEEQFKTSRAIPEDSPQTRECRSIQELHLSVFGVPKIYDANGRTHSHTDGYDKAFKAITSLLESFDK